MEKKLYEHLLSQDPIGAFKKIKEDYIRYFQHGYKINRDDLNNERVEKLRKDNNLYKEPYLEILPEYNTAEGVSNVDDLIPVFADAFRSSIDESGMSTSEAFFSKFVKVGLMNYPPYGHQVGMFEHAFCKKENVVITSGTGSGKTESFLLPLFAELFKEAITWPSPNYTKGLDWFDTSNYMPMQRHGEQRPAALRALVLYPMNALVEDQMARLRKALDSDEVRDFFDSSDGLCGNRIYFGRYTGNSIGSKSYKMIKEKADSEGNPKILKKQQQIVGTKLHEVYERFSNIMHYYTSLSPDEKKAKNDAPYVGTRLNKQSRTSEMITRWDMQITPPDIMITNTSMLSIMLMRSAEEDIFNQTRKWLEEDSSHIFHLIVDELHLYRGTSGSEVACLLRMFLHEIGLDPVIDINGKKYQNPQLRILASSASLGDEAATRKYLEEFFGVYNDDGSAAFYIQKGADYRPSPDTEKVDYSIFKAITPDFIIKDDVEKTLILNNLAKQYGCVDIVDFVAKYQYTIFSDFVSRLKKNEDNSLRPICYTDLYGSPGTMFPDEDSLRGFLIFRGYIDHLKDKEGKIIRHRLPRFRFHQFFKYIEGMWGELCPTTNGKTTPVGELSYVSQEVGPHKRKMLELLRCECCGELYIGGNKKEDNDGIFFSLNYPDLNRIPNFNPTPMVQNKVYKDYAVFWPTQIDSVALESESQHVALLNNGETSFNVTHARANWRHGYLNVNTGKFSTDKTEGEDNLINGFIYDINPDGGQPDFEKIQAMPCCCPKCGQNYTNRKFAKSPIRSFRTGMDRTNQLLSKELIYQLSEGASKLIGFSDSREDAAKQAFGIEREQYRDMVRVLFVECVKENFSAVDSIVKLVEEELDKGTRDRKIPGIVKASYPNIAKIDEIVDLVLDVKDGTRSVNELDSYRSGIVNLEPFIGKANALDGILIQKLVKLGINPAGVDYDKQFCDGEHSKHWSEAFDFEKGKIKGDTDTNYTNGVKESLKSAVFANSFGKYMGLSTIDSGIGYICCRRDSDIESSEAYTSLQKILSPSGFSVYDFVDAYIRILGDNYRYDDPGMTYELNDVIEYSRAGKLKTVVKRFAELYTIDENKLGDALFNFIARHVSNGPNIKLEFNQLAFRMVNAEDIYYECPICHRVHLHNGFGFCTNTNCMRKFDDTVIKAPVKKLWRHFISHDIIVEPKEPRRLHTEELTGQTDNIQDRLLEFKDLILLDSSHEMFRKGYELTKSIDMVNVTTTMEVGVDIGSLEAIFQGNMSPTRYNYQQRVGRGGRRGQAYSTAFTCCRGRSHDVYYYYKATEDMVGAIPVAPTLSLAPYKDTDIDGTVSYKMKQAIMKRVIIKSIFREALRGTAFDYELIDNAGEFGRICDWSTSNRTYVSNWITNNQDKIHHIIDLYFGQFNKDDVDISEEIQDVFEWINNKLICEVDKAILKYPNSFSGLAQCMAESGFLPMYGLPSDLRQFYHGYNNKADEVRSVDRQLEMSISEFAPGSEKTKDKGTYHVDGLTLPMGVKKDRDRSSICFLSETNDALSNRYTICFDKDIVQGVTDINIERIENTDQSQSALTIKSNYGLNQKMLVVPFAYRSSKIFKNYGRSIDNNERKSAFSQSIIFAKDDLNCSNTRIIGNLKVSTYGISLHDESEVWHINTNNNNFFIGEYRPQMLPKSGTDDTDSLGNFMFYNEVNGELKRIEASSRSIDIALGARKPTEMIKLELNSCNSRINLNLNTGNKSAIRSAFYSAAFLIQRTLADKLDVQPDEIEISEKINGDYPVIYLNDALPNGAGLVSYLYEGDNFEHVLRDITEFRTGFMKSLISEEHRKECLTSCQKCLKTYTNRGFHHVLDWRLGVGIINLMLDIEYDFGMTSTKDHEELMDYNNIVNACANKLNLNQAQEGQYYWNKIQRLKKTCQIIYHPLWNREIIKNQVLSENNAQSIHMYNTFKLLRSDVSEDETYGIGNSNRIGNVSTISIPSNSTADSNLVTNSSSHGQTESSTENSFGIVPNIEL